MNRAMASTGSSGAIDAPSAARIPGRRAATWLQIHLDRSFAAIVTLPALALMLVVFGLPLLFSFYLSFLGWTASKSLFGGTFVGLDNYAEIFADPTFIHSLLLTLVYTIVTVTLELLIGLGVALLLNVDVPFIGLFRAMLIVR